ncbi:MAG: hypothetical protein Q9195_003143 [Heterodermia aff. obscurata]
MGQNSNQTMAQGEAAAMSGSNSQDMATGSGQAMDPGTVGPGAGSNPLTNAERRDRLSVKSQQQSGLALYRLEVALRQFKHYHLVILQ